MKKMFKMRAFTLIEILIALAVFAIIATLSSSTIYYAFTTRSKVVTQAERLISMQLALSLVSRDVEQTVLRAVRGDEMRLLTSFNGENAYLEFTRGGVANPQFKKKQSTLQRVALLCRNNQLIRRHWESLDVIDRTRYEDKVLINELTRCQFNYLNANLQVLTEWKENTYEPFPKAVQLILSLKDWGDGVFLFPIPRAVYTHST